MEFEQKLQQLTELGFDGETARTALRRACGDLEVAASRLLTESETAAAPAEAPQPETEEQKPQRKRHRQAAEIDGVVAVLCFTCRRAKDTTRQAGLASFFAPAAAAPAAAAAAADPDALLCSKCRRQMTKPAGPSASSSSASSRVLPQIQRLRAYQRIAEQQRVPFTISDAAATRLMMEPCCMCGAPPPTEGNGLTRLRVWPAHCARPDRGGFMGPFDPANLAPACSVCNQAKTHRRVRSLVEAACHIATHRGGAGDFGRFPLRFRNNISKRSRSAYIAASSTHTKTHSLTNEAFNMITARPCRYCGKESDPPRHYNGLDRIDNECRVYNEETCDSCCGDCNFMKGKHPEDFFIAHCVKIARFNAGRTEFAGDLAEESDDGDDGDGYEGDAEATPAVDDGRQATADDDGGAEAAEPDPFAEFAFAGEPRRGR